MTPEHKQQAKQLIADWTNVSRTSTPAVWFLNADCMAGFLQELVDAPEPEPVARVTGYYAGYLSIATVDGRVLPAGTALYLALAAPTPAEAPADVARDAARYRWLRNPEQEVGLVLDKRVGFREYDEGTRTGGYPIYEYRSGEELDAAIDAAMSEKGGA